MLVYLNECKWLSFVPRCWFVIRKFCSMCSVWNVFCFCAHYTFLKYRLEHVRFLWTVHISDVPPETCSVSVHSTHFWCKVWKVICFCAQYTFLINRLEFFKILCTVHITDVPYRECSLFLCTLYICDVQSGKCSVSVRITHLWCTVRKVFCFCAQYSFLMYRLEVGRFLLYRLQIFFSVHSKHFCCTVWIVSCFCAPYPYFNVPSGKCSVSMHSTIF